MRTVPNVTKPNQTKPNQIETEPNRSGANRQTKSMPANGSKHNESNNGLGSQIVQVW